MDPMIIAGGLAAIGSLGSGIFGSLSTSNANNANVQIADANNRTAIAINEANIRAQQEALLQQNLFNKEAASTAYSRELQRTFLLDRLNSPDAIAQKYRDAGMNPAVMMSGQSAIAATSPSAPHAQASGSSGISPSIPVLTSPTMQPVPSIAGGVLNSLESVARTYKDLKSGDLSSAESDRIRGMLEAQIREAFANAGIAEMNEEFTRVFGPSLQKANLQKSVASAAVDFAHAIELAKQGNVHGSQVKLNETIASLNKAKEKLTGEEAKLYSKQIEWFDSTARAKINDLNASAESHSANARLADSKSALTDVEFSKAFRENKWLDLLDTGEMNENNKYYSYIVSQLEEAVTNKEITDLERDKLQSLIPYIVSSAKYDAIKGNPYSWEHYVDELVKMGGSTIGSGTQILLKHRLNPKKF